MQYMVCVTFCKQYWCILLNMSLFKSDSFNNFISVHYTSNIKIIYPIYQPAVGAQFVIIQFNIFSCIFFFFFYINVLFLVCCFHSFLCGSAALIHLCLSRTSIYCNDDVSTELCNEIAF